MIAGGRGKWGSLSRLFGGYSTRGCQQNLVVVLVLIVVVACVLNDIMPLVMVTSGYCVA